jgi:hypothetical protein
MRLDLIDLRLFLHVAEAGSITHGARHAHLALAAASTRIRNLEYTLGVPLLSLERRGVKLTPTFVYGASRVCRLPHGVWSSTSKQSRRSALLFRDRVVGLFGWVRSKRPANQAKSKWFFHRQAAIAAQRPQNRKRQTASENSPVRYHLNDSRRVYQWQRQYPNWPQSHGSRMEHP